jgi:hypothetical protein
MATYFLSPVPLKAWESGPKMAVRDGRLHPWKQQRLAHGACSIQGVLDLCFAFEASARRRGGPTHLMLRVRLREERGKG